MSRGRHGSACPSDVEDKEVRLFHGLSKFLSPTVPNNFASISGLNPISGEWGNIARCSRTSSASLASGRCAKRPPVPDHVATRFGAPSGLKQSWIERERRGLDDLDGGRIRVPMIDQHIVVGHVSNRHNGGGNEKQALGSSIEPLVADTLRVRFARGPVGRQAFNIDSSPRNVVRQFVSDKDLWRQKSRISHVTPLLQGSERRDGRAIGHGTAASIPAAVIG